jgi:hypothetical protein
MGYRLLAIERLQRQLTDLEQRLVQLTMDLASDAVRGFAMLARLMSCRSAGRAPMLADNPSRCFSDIFCGSAVSAALVRIPYSTSPRWFPISSRVREFDHT